MSVHECLFGSQSVRLTERSIGREENAVGRTKKELQGTWASGSFVQGKEMLRVRRGKIVLGKKPLHGSFGTMGNVIAEGL